MYADDHQVYQSGSDITAIISELTNEAENVSRWYRANLLHANPKKYQVLVMTHRNVDPDYIGELFNFNNKVYSLRNADFDVPRYSTVRYGKHSIRYLGPYLWSRLSPSDRQQPSLDNFRRNIRKKDLASLVEGTCSNCALCTH